MGKPHDSSKRRVRAQLRLRAQPTVLVPVTAVADPPGAPPLLSQLPPLPALTLVQTFFVCWLSDFLALLLMLGDIYIALININYLLSQVNKNIFLFPTHWFDVIWDLSFTLPPMLAPPGNLCWPCHLQLCLLHLKSFHSFQPLSPVLGCCKPGATNTAPSARQAWLLLCFKS